MSSRTLLPLIPLLAGFAGTGLAMHQSRITWAVPLLVGLVGGIIALAAAHLALRQASQGNAARLVVGDGGVTACVLGQELPVPPRVRTVRITLPLASHTRALSALLRSIPRSTRVELAVSSLWPVYLRGEHWRENLVTLERDLRGHFDSIAIVGTVWLSPFITLDAGDDAVGIVVPLGAAGTHVVFLNVSAAPAVRDGIRRMVNLIFHRSEPIQITEIEPPADCDPRTGFEVNP